MNRLWKFYAETEDAGSGYLLASGDMVRDQTDVEDWIGEHLAAQAEAERRADLYEEKIGGTIVRLVTESFGLAAVPVKPNIIEGTLGAAPAGWENRT